MSATTSLLKTELRLFRREPGILFWVVVFPTLLLTILGLVPSFRQPDPALGGHRVIDTYVPIAILLALILSGVQAMTQNLTGYRERGILRRMSLTPVRPATLLTAQIALHGAAALASALLAVVVGRAAFGVRLPEQAFGYLVALLLAVAVALAIGAVITSLSPTAKAASAIGTVVTFPLLFSAGLWVPVQLMPHALRTAVQLTPFGAAAQALNQAAAGAWPSWTHLGVTALWTALLAGAAVRWFRWE